MGSKTVFDGLKSLGAFQGPPEAFVIAGIDTDDTFPDNPLVDLDSNETPINEGLVAVMMQQGFVGAVVVTKLGGRPFVVDGRQTIRAARVASERLQAQGKPPIVAKATTVLPGAQRDLDLFSMVISRNEHRREKGPMERSRQAYQLHKYGADSAAIAVTMGVTEQCVRGWLDINTLAPAVQKAIEAKQIKVSAGLAVKNLPEAEQKAVIKETLESGAKPTAAEVTKRARAMVKKTPAAPFTAEAATPPAAAPAALRRGKKEVRNILEAGKDLDPMFRQGALWAIGDLEDSEVQGLLDIIKGLAAPKPVTPVKRKEPRPKAAPKKAAPTLETVFKTPEDAGFGIEDLPE